MSAGAAFLPLIPSCRLSWRGGAGAATAGAKVIVRAHDRERAATALKGIAVELQSMDWLDPAPLNPFAETVSAI